MGLFDNFRLFFKASPEAEEEPIAFDDLPQDDRRLRVRRNPRDGTRVLVVDDSRTITNALKRVLRSIGCVVDEAFDAESGLKLVLLNKPELIFLDIVLPGINGFAALRALRRDERTKHIPIIMMSGNEQMTEKFFSVRIGADDFLKKPFSRYEVFARIERLLDEDGIPRRVSVNVVPKAESPEEPQQAKPAEQAHAPVNINHQASALLHPSPPSEERPFQNSPVSAPAPTSVSATMPTPMPAPISTTAPTTAPTTAAVATAAAPAAAPSQRSGWPFN